ncbi:MULTISPECIES: endo-1,3-alpha-glucanase family glycosylhydrolase [unclassified Bradyrhizobium]
MVDEINAAKTIGLDGFTFNIGHVEPESSYAINLQRMLEAAQVTSKFEIFLSIDAVIAYASTNEALVKGLLQYAKHPSVARTSDGRLLLGAFAPERWGVARWAALLEGLSAGGERPFFFPTFLDIRSVLAFMGLMEGASMWGVNRLSELSRQSLLAKQLKQAGKAWGAVVWPQDFRPYNRWFSESCNSELFRRSWETAVDEDANIVNVCTWNDYSEGTEIRPSTSIQHAFYDLSGFYIEWFKLAKMPRIAEDTLYYFHRIEATDAQQTGTAQPFRFYNRFSDPTRNEIELLAFLTAPGQLGIETELQTHTLEAPSGITSFRIPLVPGETRFWLKRADANAINLASAFRVRTVSQYQDLLYHAGSSARSHR